MREYTTEQRKILLSFLKAHSDETFSIEELSAQLCAKKNISVSAIYRNIGKLVSDGLVQRLTKDNSRKFFYQYMGDAECCHHLHLMCTDCGQIFHLDHPSMDVITASVLQSSRFSLDKKKTVLYGLCSTCM